MMKKCLFVALVCFWCLPCGGGAARGSITSDRRSPANSGSSGSATGTGTAGRGGGRRGDREQRTPEVGLFDKFELNVDLRATFANPFDPDEVDLWAEFTAPSGKVQKIWGFYNPGPFGAVWMVRFSPTETGTGNTASGSRPGRHGRVPARRVSLRRRHASRLRHDRAQQALPAIQRRHELLRRRHVVQRQL